MKCLKPSDFTEMPWLNGGGKTYEIARESDDHGIIWRVSTARVESDCLYSLFPKLMRVSAVIEGNGICLTNTQSSEMSVIGPAVIARLSGDTLYRGALVDGGIRHLNLIYDPRRASADMTFLEDGPINLPAGAMHIVYCCAGEVMANGTEAGGSEVLIGKENVELTLTGGSRAVHISIETNAS